MKHFFFFSIFYGYFKSHEDFVKGSIIGWIIALTELSIIFALFAMAFYHPSLIKLQIPFHQLAMNIGLGRYISNMQFFFLGYWIIIGVIRFAIYIYTAAAALGYWLRIKEFEPLILPVTLLAYLLGLIPDNQMDIIFELRNSVLYKTGWLGVVILPILLWIISKIRGGNKNVNSKS